MMSFLLLFHSLLILGIYFMKILKSLALASLLVAPMVSNASPVTHLGTIAAGHSTSFNSTSLLGIFTDDYDFNSIGIVGIGAFISSLSVNFGPAVPSITNFAAKLDGHDLAFSSTPGSITTTTPYGVFTLNSLTEILAGGVVSFTPTLHTLSVSGTSILGGSYAGNVSVAAVPLPAGVWLFMTGLMGVLYTGKKKAQQA